MLGHFCGLFGEGAGFIDVVVECCPPFIRPRIADFLCCQIPQDPDRVQVGSEFVVQVGRNAFAGLENGALTEHSADQNSEENANGEQCGQPDHTAQVRPLTVITSVEFGDNERALSFQCVAPGELIHPLPQREDFSVVVQAVRDSFQCPSSIG